MMRFLWGGNDEHRKCSLIGWATVTKPKSSSGLGIPQLQHMNLSFIAKLGWKIVNDKESLCVKVISGKYMKGSNSLSNIWSKQRASNVWQGIVTSLPIWEIRVRKSIGNGRNTLFLS